VGVCIDPVLLATYRAQINSGGFRSTRSLPTVRDDQHIGRAVDTSITVAIRDTARFMDPRSRRDWWE
jgi:hypothetical protein